MVTERTLSIIKPDATARNKTGAINAIIEKAGLRIIAQKRVKWSKRQVQRFYAEHKGRSFFDDLCNYMISGPIVVQVLEGKNAIAKYRKIMGATNPKEAKEGTIRQLYGRALPKNTVHGSDSAESAEREIGLVFRPTEIIG